MKIRQKFKKSGLLVLSLLIGGFFASCSDNDDFDNDGDNTNGSHSYEITLTNKNDDLDKKTYSGKFGSTNGSAVVIDTRESEDGGYGILLSLGNENKAIVVMGWLNMDDNRNPYPHLVGEDDDSQEGGVLTFLPEELSATFFSSISGSLEVSNLKYTPTILNTSLASFKLEFDGTFLKTSFDGEGNEEEYHGKGTIIIKEVR